MDLIEEGAREMRISKKKWEALEKRMANLEREVQGQITQTPEVTADRLKEILLEQISESSSDIPSKS